MTRLSALLLVCAFCCHAAVDPAAEFDRANKLYEQGRFAEAAGAYEQLAAVSPTAAVWFNLGNAAYKAGHIGQAIRAYRAAERLAPRDAALRANLQFVRGKAYADERARVPWWKSAVRLATLNEWSMASSALLWALFAVLIAGELAGKRYTKPAILLVVLWAVVTTALLTALRDRSAIHAVVAANEATVRRGPIEESQAAFELRDGAELVVLSAKNQWLNVRDLEGRTGWVRRDAVATLPALARSRSSAQ